MRMYSLLKAEFTESEEDALNIETYTACDFADVHFNRADENWL